MDDYPRAGTPAVAEGVGMVKGDSFRGGDGQIERGARVRCTQTWGCARLGTACVQARARSFRLFAHAPSPAQAEHKLSTTKASLLRLPDLPSTSAGLTGVGRWR